MLNRLKKFIIIALLATLPTFLVWLPFLLRVGNFWSIPLPKAGMATVVANYDGPLYLVVAKTFYNRELIKANYQFPLPTEYYAAHFPLFPLLIRIFSFPLGYPYSMLFVTIASSILALFFFNKLAQSFVSEKEALWLTLVFAIFPARWLIVRSTGSADPLFTAAVIASLYYFNQKKYLLAGIWGAVAQFTKSPGILLFLAYFLAIITPTLGEKIKTLELKKIYPILLIPLSALVVFTIYYFTYGSFWTYFRSGDNIHLFFPPFQIFNYSAPWVGTFWLEEVVLVYLIGALGVIKLWRSKMGAISWFSLIFFVSTLFVSHRDIIRYSLPLVPFLILVFSETILKKEFKIALAVIVIPIYLFSLAYISQNVMPIANWAPFL